MKDPRRIQLHRFTFADMHNGKEWRDCEVVFTGNPEEIAQYAKENGYEFKANKNLFGGFYYKKNGHDNAPESLMPDIAR